MLEYWIFMAGVLLICLVVLFYSSMLLIAPNRCPSTYRWGQPSVKLVRRPPLELGKRLAGLLMSAVLLWFLVRPVILGMLLSLKHSTMSHSGEYALTEGKSPLPAGMARWDLLAFGVSTFAAGCYLLTHPVKSVELMFWADTSRLKDKTTLRLWTLQVRTAALAVMLLSLLSVATFIESLRH